MVVAMPRPPALAEDHRIDRPASDAQDVRPIPPGHMATVVPPPRLFGGRLPTVFDHEHPPLKASLERGQALRYLPHAHMRETGGLFAWLRLAIGTRPLAPRDRRPLARSHPRFGPLGFGPLHELAHLCGPVKNLLLLLLMPRRQAFGAFGGPAIYEASGRLTVSQRSPEWRARNVLRRRSQAQFDCYDGNRIQQDSGANVPRSRADKFHKFLSLRIEKKFSAALVEASPRTYSFWA